MNEYPKPQDLSRAKRRRFLEKSIDLAPVLIKNHDKLHFFLKEYFESPAEMELIRFNKHPNKGLNEAYQDYKKVLRKIKELEYIIKVFVEYDGGDKSISGDSNKKSTGLHITK